MGFALRRKVMQSEYPQHIAIIMDGNGRWAKAQGKPRTAGHLAGSENIRTIALYANAHHVKSLTLYAFSTENWSRPEEEKNYLFKLPAMFFKKYIDELKRENIRVTYIGEIERFPLNTIKVIQDAVEQTSQNTGLNLCLAINYGGRREIVCAANKLSEMRLRGEIDQITEDNFAQCLMSEYHDVDLLIRTSGEIRISNFLLWQIAYAEMIFVPCAWPDFDEKQLDDCVEEFNRRNRRFGGLK